MQIIENNKYISLTGSAIVKVLLYHDIFKYPLNKEEILERLSVKASMSDLENELKFLVEEELVAQKDGFYFIDGTLDLPAKRRKENKLAKKYLKYAKRIGRLISWFPFVRGVYLSGSISKDVMTEQSDIDFFIITAPRRLWVCKMFLILFRKLFLFNSRKFFCANFFVDERHLEIDRKDIFSAMEIATLILIYDDGVNAKFKQANHWIFNQLPNFSPTQESVKSKKYFLKRFMEVLLGGKFGRYLEKLIRNKTVNYWKSKYRKLEVDEELLAIAAEEDICYFHPTDFRKIILRDFDKKVNGFEEKWNINLTWKSLESIKQEFTA